MAKPVSGLTPDQLMAKNPWGAMMNAAPPPSPMMGQNPWGAMLDSAAPTQAGIDTSVSSAPVAAKAPAPTRAPAATGNPYARQAAKTAADSQAYVDAVGNLAPMQEQKKRLADLDALNAGAMAATPNNLDVSPILGLIDTFTGSKMAQGYQKPLTPEQRAQQVMGAAESTQKGHEALTKDTLSQAKALEMDALQEQRHNQDLAKEGYALDENGNVTVAKGGMADAKMRDLLSQAHQRDAMAKYYGAPGGGGGSTTTTGGTPAVGTKGWNAMQKSLQDLQKDIDPYGPRSGAFGKTGEMVQKATRLQGLLANGKDLTAPQMEEMAIGIQNMLSSGTGNGAQVAALIPHSVIGDKNKLVEWLQNSPQGLGQQAFVENMSHLLDREKAINEGMIHDIQAQRLGRHGPTIAAFPKDSLAILNKFHLDADGNIIPTKGAAPAPGAAPANGASSGGKPKTVTQNGHTYTLNEATGGYE